MASTGTQHPATICRTAADRPNVGEGCCLNGVKEGTRNATTATRSKTISARANARTTSQAFRSSAVRASARGGSCRSPPPHHCGHPRMRETFRLGDVFATNAVTCLVANGGKTFVCFSLL